MKKAAAVIMCMMLAGFVFAKDQEKSIRENLGLKKAIGDLRTVNGLRPMETQATQGDRSRILMLTSYVTDGYGEIMHCLDLDSTDMVSFWIEFTTIFRTDVKFHFIWTGPEFYYHETDWYDVEYGDYYYLSVDTNTNWRRGTYKLVVIAEQGIKGGGAHAVMECNVQFY